MLFREDSSADSFLRSLPIPVKEVFPMVFAELSPRRFIAPLIAESVCNRLACSIRHSRG